MDVNTRASTDMVITKKMMKHTNMQMLDYFNNEFVQTLIHRNISFRTVYDKLCDIENDGLFLPILVNELNKYASKVYPCDPNHSICTTMIEFTEYIHRLVTRERGDNLSLVFLREGLRIMIILAISDLKNNTNTHISLIENAIDARDIDTVYVLASGSKVGYAKEIAEMAYLRNLQQLFEPTVCKYKRYTNRPFGVDSVCYEINIMN